MTHHSKKILVAGPAWVGDMVMAQAFLKALQQQNPQAQIDLIVPDSLVGLVQRMPQVNEVIGHRLQHGQAGLRARRQIGSLLRAKHYTASYVLQRSFKSALIPWFAKIPTRIGHVGEMRWGVLNRRYTLAKGKSRPHVCNYLQLLDMDVDIATVKKNFAPSLDVDLNNQRELCKRFDLQLDRPIVALMPGAEFGPSKQWPIENFKQLAKRLLSRGFQVIVLGGPKEQELCKVFDECEMVFNLVGVTKLPDVVDLLALCKVAVSNDSGLMHIANAVQCPTICLYGATAPDYTPPLSQISRVLYLYLECSPCWERNCAYNHYRCLRDISIDKVEQVFLSICKHYVNTCK